MTKIKQADTKFYLVFTPTVSILNVANFKRFVEWAANFARLNHTKNSGWDMVPIFLHGPQFQDMIYANTDYRHYALAELNSIDPQALGVFASLQNFYDEVCDTLKNKYHNEPESIMFRKQLRKWNTSIDNSRGIKIEDYIPYSKLLYEQ